GVARSGGRGDGAAGEDDGVGGMECVDTGRHVIVEQAGRQSVTAEECARRRLVERLDARGRPREIDREDPTTVAAHGQRLRSARPCRAAAARSAGTPLCAVSLRYTVAAAAGCLSAARTLPAPRSAPRPPGAAGPPGPPPPP